MPGAAGGHGHHGHGEAPRMESEHRPVSERRYGLNLTGLSEGATAHLLRADGELTDIDLNRVDGSVGVVFETPLGEDAYHGANSVYVVDRSVEDGVLLVRTAKWITLHHSCRWGHDHKFNEARKVLRPWEEAPLELLADPLWDSNFHIGTMAGDTLRFRVLLRGAPAANASLRIQSGKGWAKHFLTDDAGVSEVQLIRDYYPSAWSSFRRNHRERLVATASVEIEEQGVWNGEPYSRVRYLTTLPWKYAPARSEYASHRYGLILSGASALLLGFGIFLYRERRGARRFELGGGGVDLAPGGATITKVALLSPRSTL